MNDSSNEPVFVIGLDSADFYLIEKWTEEGLLPNLQALIEEGTWGCLKSTADVGSSTVWPALFTGTSPAKHNAVGSRHMEPGTYKLRYQWRINKTETRPLWEYLSEGNKKSMILDIPKTCPIKDENIKQVMGWGAHSPSWPPASYPPHIIKDIHRKFGKYPAPDDDEFIPTGKKQLTKFFGQMLEGIETKGKIIRHYLKEEPLDFFLATFAEPHCVGHNYWHVLDPKHPAYDSETHEAIGNAILKVYQAVDQEIGQIVAEHEDAAFFIVSPEGMGPNYTGSHLMTEVLQKLGYTGVEKKEKSLIPGKRWGPHAIRIMKAQLSLPVVKFIEFGKKILPRDTWHRMKCFIVNFGADFRRHRAYCYPSDFSGAIRINLKGREPQGIVELGEEYEVLCDEIVEEMKQLVNIDTGESASVEVFKVDNYHEGNHRDTLPDIIVRWRGDAPITGLRSEKLGTLKGKSHHERSGAHRPHGFFIAKGKGIKAGEKIEGGHIMDIAPTLLHLLKQPVPEAMDGKVLKGVFRDGNE